MSNNIKEYWIFIDDSGNIELSDESKYFIYAGLLFQHKKDIEEFRINFEKTLISLFGNNKEVKGSDRISKEKRIKINNCIINSNCKLFCVIVEKNSSYMLKNIEKQFKILSDNINKNKKAKRIIKKIRKNEYGRQKTYFIGQLITLIKKKNIYNKNAKINIISDKEYLYYSKFETMDKYLKYGQKYLSFFDYEFNFKMEDSKKDYCLQGADFVAYSIGRAYNEEDKEFFNYIDNLKHIVYKNLPFLNKEDEISKNIDKNIKIDNI
ncbi:DUF3800 domain-containing protein [Spiroplasma endosymbiont of Villa modesta]|uniref:DUF3800 domain-containing protein n=1 Tax=Spiroplasma endosymbiont of Villa modesta TaxID=3066293 RepID=UPI00313CF16F